MTDHPKFTIMCHYNSGLRPSELKELRDKHVDPLVRFDIHNSQCRRYRSIAVQCYRGTKRSRPAHSISFSSCLRRLGFWASGAEVSLMCAHSNETIISPYKAGYENDLIVRNDFRKARLTKGREKKTEKEKKRSEYQRLDAMRWFVLKRGRLYR